MRNILIWIVIGVTADLLSAQQNVRVKDVTHIKGVEELQLYGYGLVVGLERTGDRFQTIFTEQSVINMLRNIGISLPEKHLRLRNVAAVMVTGTLAPFKSKGSKFDVTVSSMGDATSLEGGTLILTALQGADGKMYASAQGPLATGGYDVHNRGLTRIKKNHVMVGRIPDGAIVQKEYAFNIINTKDLSLSLSNPDFSSAVSLAESINSTFKNDKVANAIDAATVSLNFSAIASDPATVTSTDLISFISQVENCEFSVGSQAKVVVNERTGTIVAGGLVRISEIAVSHGSIKVEITNTPEVIQPQPYNFTGITEKIINPETLVEEKDADMVVLNSTATVSDLAQALNSLGVSPRDVIAILQAIKQAGALQAHLVIM